MSIRGGQILINIGGNGSSQLYTLTPEGVLAGDGSTITLIGKRQTGQDALNDPTYVGSSDTCSYGNLTPRGQPQRSGSTTTSNATTAPVGPRSVNNASNNGTSAPVPNNTPRVNTPNAVQPTVLHISTGFAGQPANPLSGRELLFLNQSFEEVLMKAGFQNLPGAVANRFAIANWAAACKSQSPMCKQGIDAMNGSYEGKIRLDLTGSGGVSGIPKGTHWLIGIGAANNQHYVWNLRVDIGSGTNSIQFVPGNAAIIY